MKKSLALLTALLAGSVAVSAYAGFKFNNEQLDQFEKTNKCAGCDLSGAELSKNHSGAVLTGANLSSVHVFEPHEFPGLNLSGSNLQNVNFSGAELEDANFSQADLTGARFDGADLVHANFYGAKGVDLKNARNYCLAILPDGSQKVCD